MKGKKNKPQLEKTSVEFGKKKEGRKGRKHTTQKKNTTTMSPEELKLLTSSEDIHALWNLLQLVLFSLVCFTSMGLLFRNAVKSRGGTVWKKKFFEMEKNKHFFWTKDDRKSK